MGDNKLSNNSQSKDDSLEALDFIVNVLKEHEKDLDKLINELATVTEQLGDTGDLGGKVERVEEKITSLQKEVANLMSYISGAPREESPTAAKEPKDAPHTSVDSNGPSRRSFIHFEMHSMGRLPELSVPSSNVIFQLQGRRQNLPG